MVLYNKNLARISPSYLFPKINKRKKDFLDKNPGANLISLGIGDTTHPIMPKTLDKTVEGAKAMGTIAGYHGYPDDGFKELKWAISKKFYNSKFDEQEIWISDGAKGDIARLQLMFGSNIPVVVQDPAYPVYIDGSIISGAVKSPKNIQYLKCTASNNFFPDSNSIKKIKKGSIIYFCSPNNPTGAVSSKEELKVLVDTAISKKCIIIFDAAYSEYIQDKNLPKSIFEIEGATNCAIEVNSFSKPAGFTGVRLGWTTIPKGLKFENGNLVSSAFSRVYNTVFNGASVLSQRAGLGVLSIDGIKEMKELVNYYLGNAKLIKEVIDELGFKNFGGINSPYIWADFKQESWKAFDEILNKCNIITTPGSGFGPSGEGYLRFSAFNQREMVVEATNRLKKFI